MLVLSLVANLLGVNRFLTANGTQSRHAARLCRRHRLRRRLHFAADVEDHGQVEYRCPGHRASVVRPPKLWLVDTVARLAKRAGLPMPEVAIYDRRAECLRHRRDRKNGSLVAVSTGLLQSDDARGGRGRAGARGRATSPTATW
ncbi:MAG: hypothetical protein MZW92_00365 [Comamonadaceae bacterium]|nr:hypothetical protein [Comamonadaceae bacterium]